MSNRVVKQLVLEQLQFCAEVLIPQALVDNTKVSVQLREDINSYIASIGTFAWSEGLSADHYTVEFSFPTTWWQHLKKERFPVWLLKWFPVKEEKFSRSIEIVRRAVYPTLATQAGLKQGQDFIIRTDVKDTPLQ